MPPHIDSSTAAGAPAPQVLSTADPRFNARKHGFYSAGILLPGEDAEAFRLERMALFHLYRPQTVREAQLVDQMAQWQWQLDRSSPLQARCDAQALEPVADAAHRVTEPLAHQRLHTTMDVALHRLRLDRAVRRNERDLLGLQKLRRMGLVEGAVRLPPGCYLERSGEIVPVAVPDRPAARQVAPAEAKLGAAAQASGSKDGQSGKCKERKETGEGSPQVAGPVRMASSPAVRPGGDARPTGPEQSTVEWPDGFTGREGKHHLAASARSSVPPSFPASAPGWVGYSAVSSL